MKEDPVKPLLDAEIATLGMLLFIFSLVLPARYLVWRTWFGFQCWLVAALGILDGKTWQHAFQFHTSPHTEIFLGRCREHPVSRDLDIFEAALSSIASGLMCRDLRRDPDIRSLLHSRGSAVWLLCLDRRPCCDDLWPYHFDVFSGPAQFSGRGNVHAWINPIQAGTCRSNRRWWLARTGSTPEMVREPEPTTNG